MTSAIVALRKPRSKQGTPSIEVVDLTPSMAQEWLKKNRKNRNIRRNTVTAYARDMATGHWYMTGDPIQFNREGALVNGQHRLSALITADVTLPFVVVKGLDDEAQDSIDLGAKRTMADQLSIHQEKNSAVLAAIIRRAVLWEHGFRGNVSGYKATEAEMRDYLERHPECRASAEVATRGKNFIAVPCSVLGLVHHLLMNIDLYGCEQFFIKLVDGVGLQPGDPCYAARRQITQEVERRGPGGGGRIHETNLLATIIKAWNLVRAGETVSRISRPRDGWTQSNFPEPR